MVELAKEKMPKANLYQGDFSKGLVGGRKECKYDAIIATYSLHHLTDDRKIHFLKELLSLLNDGGYIYIGDVIFKTRTELEKHRILIGNEWDKEEIYLDEFIKSFPKMSFQQFSFCSGLFSLY